MSTGKWFRQAVSSWGQRLCLAGSLWHFQPFILLSLCIRTQYVLYGWMKMGRFTHFGFITYLLSASGEGNGTHSSTLVWKIPWTEEPGRLQSMGSLRAGHNWATSLSFFTFMHWRRKWQPAPVFLPGESQGQWSLMGCCLWGRTESDTTEAT